MYSPDYYREDDSLRQRKLMRAYPFAVLVCTGPAGLEAVHLPLLLHDDEATLAEHPLGLLRGHVARANPIWRGMDGQREALAIFSGPHAYISPSMYVSRPQVPTWNYLAVHACGVPRLLEDQSSVRAHLHEMIRRLEDGRTTAWSIDADAEAEYFERLLPGLVAFELVLQRVEGKRKLNQNKSLADRQQVIAALAAASDSAAREIAAQMTADLNLSG